jgi:hypothetical protein
MHFVPFCCLRPAGEGRTQGCSTGTLHLARDLESEGIRMIPQAGCEVGATESALFVLGWQSKKNGQF